MEYETEYSVQNLAETFLNQKNFQLGTVTQPRVSPYRVPDFYVRSTEICIFTSSWNFPRRQQYGQMDGQKHVHNNANICF